MMVIEPSAFGAPDVSIVPVQSVELRLVPRPWPFAFERRDEIAAYFAKAKRAKPALFNGRILLMHAHSLSNGEFRADYMEADFASFLAWRDWGFPDPAVGNCFGMAALRACDGAFMLGVMGGQTANAGKAYFPSGTLEPADLVGDTVDVDGSVRRELREETGLDADTMEIAADWHVVFAPPRIALMKTLQSSENADALRDRMLRHTAREVEPELSDVRIVRTPHDLDASVPNYTAGFITYAFRQESQG